MPGRTARRLHPQQQRIRLFQPLLSCLARRDRPPGKTAPPTPEAVSPSPAAAGFVDGEALVAALRPLLPEEAHDLVDGKALRRSQRETGAGALGVLTVAGQALGTVWAPRRREGGDERTGARALLEELPLAREGDAC